MGSHHRQTWSLFAAIEQRSVQRGCAGVKEMARQTRCCIFLGLALLLPELRSPSTWVTSPRTDAATGYYTAALKGAAKVEGSHSNSFKRLAQLHFRAVELRRQRSWNGATEVYRKALALQETMPEVKEVPKFAVAACSWLNLALTQQNNKCLDKARQTFQEGTRMVQELMHRDLDVWIDGRHRLRSHRQLSVDSSEQLRVACRWLATLLVAWGLLETKTGHRGRAKVLAERAAFLDGSKAKVLHWKIVTG